MTHAVSRTLLVALVALISGCARGSQAPQDQAEPAAEPRMRDGVTASDLATSPSMPIEQLLQSKVPGIIVTRAEDGSVAIRIRGTSSFTGGNDPLYVIDGIAIQPGPSGSLTGINPYDIASIRVLKDPADLTMYGSRGANGVIVIKTKKPNQ